MTDLHPHVPLVLVLNVLEASLHQRYQSGYTTEIFTFLCVQSVSSIVGSAAKGAKGFNFLYNE